MKKMSSSPFGVTFTMTLGSISNLKDTNPTDWATLWRVFLCQKHSVLPMSCLVLLLQVAKTRDHYCIISFAISGFSSQEKLHLVDLPSGFKITNTGVQNSELVPNHLPTVTCSCLVYFSAL